MVSEAPPFWWNDADWRAWLLYPASRIYGSVARSRLEKAPRAPVDRPVLCIGNFTVGGAGKTPTALAIALAAIEAGIRPGFLSRGYQASIRTTTVVDPEKHNAHDVGDEPVLLARRALTVIAPNRLDGARRLIEEGADIIILDDGFQSAAIHFDHALLVVDDSRGIGNGHIIPGGPLRAPLVDQMRFASSLLVIGDGRAADPVVRCAGRAAKPVYTGRFTVPGFHQFRDRQFLAFAGIGNPGKFFDSLRSTGAKIVAQRSFADHHVFADDEIAEMLTLAERQGLGIVTTAKDMVRLKSGHGRSAELAQKAAVLNVELEFDPPDLPELLIRQTVEAFKKRQLTKVATPAS